MHHIGTGKLWWIIRFSGWSGGGFTKIHCIRTELSFWFGYVLFKRCICAHTFVGVWALHLYLPQLTCGPACSSTSVHVVLCCSWWISIGLINKVPAVTESVGTHASLSAPCAVNLLYLFMCVQGYTHSYVSFWYVTVSASVHTYSSVSVLYIVRTYVGVYHQPFIVPIYIQYWLKVMHPVTQCSPGCSGIAAFNQYCMCACCYYIIVGGCIVCLLGSVSVMSSASHASLIWGVSCVPWLFTCTFLTCVVVPNFMGMQW